MGHLDAAFCECFDGLDGGEVIEAEEGRGWVLEGEPRVDLLMDAAVGGVDDLEDGREAGLLHRGAVAFHTLLDGVVVTIDAEACDPLVAVTDEVLGGLTGVVAILEQDGIVVLLVDGLIEGDDGGVRDLRRAEVRG